ncbi:hypothetical protein IX51_03100 [uncultured archaeon]|nr:hypothetical protein IX51_03100 [uncultured archaeon]
MEIHNYYENGSGFDEAISLVSALQKLKLKGNDWTYSINAWVEGRSGLMHQFDFLISSAKKEDRIVCMLLKSDAKDRMGRIATFFAHSKDVNSTRAVIIFESAPAMEEKMLSTSLGMEILLNGRTGEDSYRGRGPEAEENGALKYRKNSFSRGPKKRYRDRTQIIHEILSSTSDSGGATITKIIFKCNLNYRNAKEIIGDMIKKQLLEVKRDEENKKVYRITKVGSNIMEKLHYYDSVNGKHMRL